MERKQIAELLDKYWQAETTVEEERMLADYFRGADVPVEWESYREVFSFYEEERVIKPSPELEERIMEQVRVRPGFRAAWWAAAAAIIVLLGVEPLLRVAPVKETTRPLYKMTAQVKDTYDDPQQALAAVQKALLVASKNMNRGLHSLK